MISFVMLKTKQGNTMKTYQATLKHDNGTHRMTVKAETIDQARNLICKAENCPPGAVQLRCKILESDPETVYLEYLNDYLTDNKMAQDYGVPVDKLRKVIDQGRQANWMKDIDRGHEIHTTLNKVRL